MDLSTRITAQKAAPYKWSAVVVGPRSCDELSAYEVVPCDARGCVGYTVNDGELTHGTYWTCIVIIVDNAYFIQFLLKVT